MILDTCRVQLVANLQAPRKVLRVRNGRAQVEQLSQQVWGDFKGTKGHGREGQVKRATWYSRSITLLNIKLNRGSAIDFINALVEKMNLTSGSALKPLKKGGIFKRGASDKDITELFNTVYEEVVKKPEILKDLGQTVEKAAEIPVPPLYF